MSRSGEPSATIDIEDMEEEEIGKAAQALASFTTFYATAFLFISKFQ